MLVRHLLLKLAFMYAHIYYYSPFGVLQDKSYSVALRLSLNTCTQNIMMIGWKLMLVSVISNTSAFIR